MLKDIGRMRWEPLLVQEFRLHSLTQFTLNYFFLKPGNSLDQIKRNPLPSTAPNCTSPLAVAESIQMRHQGIMQGGGNREPGRGPVSS